MTNKKADGTVLDSYTYNYDLANNITSKVDAKGTTSYEYDKLNRLTKVTEPNATVTTYTFDAAGNRLTETIVSGGNTKVTTYSYNEQNRLLGTETKVNGIVTETSSFTYDNNGSQLTETKTVYIDGIAQPSRITQNNYDELNQLIETITPDGNNIVHIYNGEGVRVAKAVNGVIRRYFYEGDKVVLEVDENNNQIARNVYGTNLLTRVVDGQTVYYMYNGHGDVTKLINPAGDTLSSYYYDAFGKITEETGTIDNPFRYAGYQYDKETGTYYLMARMYNPETARFLQEDTYRGDVKDPLSLNLYTYTHNEPIMHDDPTGHWIHIAMGALVGAAINTAITAYQDYKDDGKFNSGAKVYLASAAQGAIEGAVGAATGGAGLFARAAINGAAAFVGNAIGQKIKKGTVNWKEAAFEGAVGAGLTVGGHYAGKLAKQSKVAKPFESKVSKFKENLSSKLQSAVSSAKEASTGLKLSVQKGKDFGKVGIPDDLKPTKVQLNFKNVMREAEENAKNAVIGNGTKGVTQAKSQRWLDAEEKLAKAAQGSGGSGGVDFIATSNGTAVHASQTDMINSITNAGAIRIGPTSQTSEIGEIFQMNTKYGPMEIRVMPGQPGTTSAFKGPRTINTIPGTGTYVYPNGERIIGAVSKSDRKLIGHIHGQRP